MKYSDFIQRYDLLEPIRRTNRYVVQTRDGYFWSIPENDAGRQQRGGYHATSIPRGSSVSRMDKLCISDRYIVSDYRAPDRLVRHSARLRHNP